MKAYFVWAIGISSIIATVSLMVYKAGMVGAPFSTYLQGSFLLPSLFVLTALSVFAGNRRDVGTALGVACTGIVLLALENQVFIKILRIDPVHTPLTASLNILAAVIAFLAASKLYVTLMGSSVSRDLLSILLLIGLVGLFQRLEAGPDIVIHTLDNFLLLTPFVLVFSNSVSSGLIRRSLVR